MIETFCKEHKLTLFECVACQREDYPMLHEEPMHCGESIANTAIDLWNTRTENAKLRARIEDLIRGDDEENR